MADGDNHHEWSFEAQWTWSSGGSSGSGRSDEPKKSFEDECGSSGSKDKESKCQFSTKQQSLDKLSVNPTITRVYHDGGSEIQMEYSWQHPQNSPTSTISVNQQQRGELNVSGGPASGQRQPRPKTFHMGEFSNADHTSYSRESNVQEPVSEQRPAHRAYGSNGRSHHHHHSTYKGDSGYGSNELPSPTVRYKMNNLVENESGAADASITTTRYNKAMAIIPPSNGRCKSSCNITLEGNNPSIWSTARTQPVFHGPNCECIVCHDMQVRFESTPAVRNSPKKSQEVVRVIPTKGAEEKIVHAPRPEPLFSSSPPPPPTPMFRSHFCTHVRGKRPVSFTPSSDSEIDNSVNPITLESVSEPIKEMIDRLAELPLGAAIGEWKRDEDDPQANVPWRHRSKDTSSLDSPSPTKSQRSGQSDSEKSSESRRRHRYSYPSATIGRLKPRVIRIDVYCADDDEEGSSDGEHLPKGLVIESARSSMKDEDFPINVYTNRTSGSREVAIESMRDKESPHASKSSRSEAFLRAERLFGGNSSGCSKRTIPHVGPAKNKNCNCDSCLRHFSELSASSTQPTVFSRSRPTLSSSRHHDAHTGESKNQNLGSHLNKPQ